MGRFFAGETPSAVGPRNCGQSFAGNELTIKVAIANPCRNVDIFRNLAADAELPMDEPQATMFQLLIMPRSTLFAQREDVAAREWAMS